MRNVVLIFGLLAALSLSLVATAGGKGALETTLFVGKVVPDDKLPGETRVYPDGAPVGFVVFNTTANDTMNVTVQVQDGAPDTTFVARLVPKSWGDPEVASALLTTNKKGKGQVHFSVPIPAGIKRVDGTVWSKVTLTSGGEVPIGYATELEYVPLKK